MEQRTRILHTRYKKPVILSSSCGNPRIVASSSLSSLSAGRQDRAPLASLDKELSSASRRAAKSRHRNGHRSASTGRREEGSKRIVSREVLKSDEISDWSGNDTDTGSVSSSSLSTPLRRHTMGAVDRPNLRNSQESLEKQPASDASRMSSPPRIDTFPDRRDSFQGRQDPNWSRFSQTLPNRSTPRGIQLNGDEANPNCRVFRGEKEQVEAQARLRPPSNNAPPSTQNVNNNSIKQMCDLVASPTTPTNSNSYQARVPYLSNSNSRPNSCHQFQKDPVPISTPSQVISRRSANLSMTSTSAQRPSSDSSHRQSTHRPPSSLNIRQNTRISSPPITSPTTRISSPPITSPTTRISSPPITSPTTRISSPPITSPTTRISSPPITSPSTRISSPTITSPSTRISSPPITSPSTRISSSPVTSPTNSTRHYASPSHSQTTATNATLGHQPTNATQHYAQPSKTNTATTNATLHYSPPPQTNRTTTNATLHYSPPPQTNRTTTNATLHYSPSPQTNRTTTNATLHNSPPPQTNRTTTNATLHKSPPPQTNRTTTNATLHNSPPPQTNRTTTNATLHNSPPPQTNRTTTNATLHKSPPPQTNRTTTNATLHNSPPPQTNTTFTNPTLCHRPTNATRDNAPPAQTIITATTNSATSCQEPVYSWKIDPRRRPLPAADELALSPEKESRGIVSPQHSFSQIPSPTMPRTYSSPTTENPGGRQRGDISRSDKAHDNNSSHWRPIPHQQNNRSPTSSSSDRRVNRENSHHPPSTAFTQSNHDRNLPRQDHGIKAYSNYLINDHMSFSPHSQTRNQTLDHSFGSQASNSRPLSNNINYEGASRQHNNMDPFVPEPFRFGRKRESMRLATEGFLASEFPDLSEPRQGMKPDDSKPKSEYSGRPGVSRTSFTHYEKPEGRRDNRFSSPPPPEKCKGDGYNMGHIKHQDSHIHNTMGHAKYQSSDIHNNFITVNSLPFVPEPFVRRSIKRDSYRLATSSNPDLTSIDRADDIFVSCEDILDSNQSTMTRNTPVSFKDLYGDVPHPADFDVFPTSSDQSHKHSNYNNPKPGNAERLSRIKRNSLRLATASLSDLSVILDEIDISESSEPSPSICDSIEHPSPLFIPRGPKLSPLVERSLGRSGSSVSSKNSSSFGSFYSCQSIAHSSAKSSPYHTSSHSSPRVTRPNVSTPDSVHKLIMANAHDSGISQSSEDTHSFFNSTNNSIGSAEEMEYGMNHCPLVGSLNRKRPVFYWTRQAPYPRQAPVNSNTIPASWKPKQVTPPKAPVRGPSRYSNPGNIRRGYGSTSSVESGTTKSKPVRQIPASSQFLQRYGCGLDGRGPLFCSKGSTDSLSHNALQGKQQSQHRNSVSSGNRENFSLPIHPNSQYRPGDSSIDTHHSYDTRLPDPDSPPILESPNADTPRSPPSLGRPRRKMYAGFDSQPLPMDIFMSDSSSVYTGASCSSRATDISGQPDSGTFDESFYSIDARSLVEEKDYALEASLTPNDFMNLSDIRHDTQIRNQCRSSSVHSTSTAKEGDTEYSDNDEDRQNLGQTMTQYQHHHSHHHHAAWPGANYNHGIPSSLPMTFSI